MADLLARHGPELPGSIVTIRGEHIRDSERLLLARFLS
jgi:hypothetical protein